MRYALTNVRLECIINSKMYNDPSLNPELYGSQINHLLLSLGDGRHIGVVAIVGDLDLDAEGAWNCG